ncbi:ABC transporter permease [Aeromonas veronii]
MRAADLLFWLWRALLAGRSRSLLSALGIAIGIASVTLLTGIGEGLRLYLLDSFSQFGTRLIAVTPGKTETAGGRPASSPAAVPCCWRMPMPSPDWQG